MSILLIALGASSMGSGCGGDSNTVATFQGNVSSVSPPQAMREAPLRRWLAEVDSFVVPKALAQSTCSAKHVIVCASNGRDSPICTRVDSDDCTFLLALDVSNNDFGAGSSFGFMDDVNGNRAIDSGETIAFLFTPPGRVCNGSVVTLRNVAIDFTNGSSTAESVVKDPDTCRAFTPGPSPTASSTPTPSPTPTYAAGASLHQAPSNMLAFLSGVGVVGLLLPSRRRQRRKS